MDMFNIPQGVIDEYHDDHVDVTKIDGLVDPNIIDDCTKYINKEPQLMICPNCSSKCCEIKEFGKNKILTCKQNHIWVYNGDESISIILKKIIRCPECNSEQISTTYISNYKLHRCSNDHTWGRNITTNQSFELLTKKREENQSWLSAFFQNCFSKST